MTENRWYSSIIFILCGIIAIIWIPIVDVVLDKFYEPKLSKNIPNIQIQTAQPLDSTNYDEPPEALREQDVDCIDNDVKYFANKVLLMYGSDNVDFKECKLSKTCKVAINNLQKELFEKDKARLCLSNMFDEEIRNNLQSLINDGTLFKKGSKYFYEDNEEYDSSSGSDVYEEEGKFYIDVNNLDVNNGCLILYKGFTFFIAEEQIPKTYQNIISSNYYNYNFESVEKITDKQYKINFVRNNTQEEVNVYVTVNNELITGFEIKGVK